jgi:ABC-type phosphate/phosphonate transport system ATPase subunit
MREVADPQAVTEEPDVSQVADRIAAASVLRVEGISKAFGTRKVVSRISFTLAAHEMVALLGPSGAGKTTLFRCFTGCCSPMRAVSGSIMAMRHAQQRRAGAGWPSFSRITTSCVG